MNKKKVVIVGGGFAGLNLAKKLMNYERFNILLVDRNNNRTYVIHFEKCSRGETTYVSTWAHC